MIHISYKFRLYPTEYQKVFLNKHFGCSRFVYNYFLGKSKKEYETYKLNIEKGIEVAKPKVNYCLLSKELTNLKQNEKYAWIKEVNSQTLQMSIKNLETSYKRFFKNQSNFPNFKKRNNNNSFKIPQNFKLEKENNKNKLFIPKLKSKNSNTLKGIKINLYRKIKGKILSVTISKTKTNKYYASFACEITNFKSFPKTEKSVGLDTGINNLVTQSNGIIIENIKPLKEKLKKIRYNHKLLSRKKKGSNNRSKQRIKLAKTYEKVTNIRKHYLHQITTDIVKNQDNIFVEDLNVKGMIQNNCLSFSISDLGLGEFYSMLKYKSEWHGRNFIKIDRFYPSSKLCSVCGYKNNNLLLGNRTWECIECNTKHDRDMNAAQNILKEGLRLLNLKNSTLANNNKIVKVKLSGCEVQSDFKQKQGEAFPLGESVSLENQFSFEIMKKD